MLCSHRLHSKCLYAGTKSTVRVDGSTVLVQSAYLRAGAWSRSTLGHDYKLRLAEIPTSSSIKANLTVVRVLFATP